MVIQGQPKVPDGVAMTKVPDIHHFCGSEMLCGKEEVMEFFGNWSDPNHAYSDAEFDRYDNNGDGVVDEEEMWNPSLPSFDKVGKCQVQWMLQKADPDVQTQTS